MKIDMHCHVLGNGKNILDADNDIYYNIVDNPMGSFDARKLLVKNIVTNVILTNISKKGGSITNNGSEIKLWADTSALTAATRIMYLEKIMGKIHPGWLLNGSDFPVPISGLEHLPIITPGMTFKEYIDIMNTKNPFDLDVKIKRAHGFSDSILENPSNVLRLN